MKEYLDKEKVMETIREAPFSRSMCMTQEECNGAKMAQNVIARLVDETIPVEEIEPVIRCKDCKNWIPGKIRFEDDLFIPPKCCLNQQMVGHSNDDYCSFAERRDE